jgi:AcrR family transcriptional regulator
MAAIAEEAGVSLKTVYVAFETKSGVLRALWNLLLRGDQEEIPVGERPWYREVVEEPDPARVVRLIRSAAPLDPDIAGLWGRIQSDFHANQRGIVEALSKRKALRRGLTVERGSDILWTLNHPDVWHLLVGERGWTPEQWERWFEATMAAQLLRAGNPGEDQ